MVIVEISGFIIDLGDLPALDAGKGVSDGCLDAFGGGLSGLGFNIAPFSEADTATRASDGAVVVRLVLDPDTNRPAIRACE